MSSSSVFVDESGTLRIDNRLQDFKIEDLQNALVRFRAGQMPPFHEICIDDMEYELVEGSEELGVLLQLCQEIASTNSHELRSLIMGHWSEYEIASIVSIIDSFSNQLRRLEFDYINETPGMFIEPLLGVLQRLHKLEEIELVRVWMDAQDYLLIARSLSTLPNLKRVAVDDRSMDEATMFVPLLETYASIGSLEVLKVNLTRHTFEDLDLENFFAAMHTHHSLKTLAIFVCPVDCSWCSDQSLNHMATMLRQNTSIEEIGHIGRIEGQSLKPILVALEDNTTLKCLRTVKPLTGEELIALLGVMERRNTTLENLVDRYNYWRNYNAEEAENYRKIQFYLLLNQGGFQRRHLLAQLQDCEVVVEDWVDVITAWKDRTDIVYYYLSMNVPLIVGANLDSSAIQNHVGKKRKAYNLLGAPGKHMK